MKYCLWEKTDQAALLNWMLCPTSKREFANTDSGLQEKQCFWLHYCSVTLFILVLSSA